MAADENGMDLDAVSVPITGRAAYAPVDQANVIADTEMGKSPFKFPDGYKQLGLYKADGGPQESREQGDDQELFQQGYKLAGDSTLQLVINLAEDNENVNELIRGKKADSNGVVYVDAALPSNRFIMFTVTRYRNGFERRRNGVARVASVEVDQETRGEIRGQAVTFEWVPSPLFNDSPYKEWLGKPGKTAGGAGPA